jgi:hypothetical protein
LLVGIVTTSPPAVLGGTSQGVLEMTSKPGSSFCILQLKVINHIPLLVPDAVQTCNCHVVQFFEKGVQPWTPSLSFKASMVEL